MIFFVRLAFQNSSLHVKESKTISTPWIPDSRYNIPDSLSAELAARNQIVSEILDSGLELYSGFQNLGFRIL